MSKKNFHEKVVFITGSTRGIGWETAKLFAQEGATIIINGHADLNTVNQRAEELQKQFNVPSLGILADFGKCDQIEDCYRQIFERFKKLDVLVNNAGIMHNAGIGMISQENARQSFDLNCLGPIFSIQSAARLMRRHKTGSIVNVSSIRGIYGSPGQMVYSGSKAAVIGITKSAALELAPNIRVNCIAPGMIETHLLDRLSEKDREIAPSKIALKRTGQAKDVAEAILFLASERASYITGQVLGVDGGII